jgi:hypothetical protein
VATTVGYGEIGLKRLKKVGLAHLRGATVGNTRARALVGLWVWRARPTGGMG